MHTWVTRPNPDVAGPRRTSCSRAKTSTSWASCKTRRRAILAGDEERLARSRPLRLRMRLRRGLSRRLLNANEHEGLRPCRLVGGVVLAVVVASRLLVHGCLRSLVAAQSEGLGSTACPSGRGDGRSRDARRRSVNRQRPRRAGHDAGRQAALFRAAREAREPFGRDGESRPRARAEPRSSAHGRRGPRHRVRLRTRTASCSRTTT